VDRSSLDFVVWCTNRREVGVVGSWRYGASSPRMAFPILVDTRNIGGEELLTLLETESEAMEFVVC
jgi:hypothetical protein